MGHDSSPGDLARVTCAHCGELVFFVFKGGPLVIACPACTHAINVEMVHDGRRWRVKDLQRNRRLLQH